ncbi:MAG: single-stranded DNA-binding protein [Patescibacteria group bacterium]
MSSRSLNKVLLIGNLTRDPELRFTPQGTAVCTFGLATNRSWTTGEGGERNEQVEYHRVVAWSKLAEICGQLLKKGRKAFVEGRLQTREWTTQEGQKRQVTEIVIENMLLLDSAGKGASGDASSFAYPADDKSGASAGASASAGVAGVNTTSPAADDSSSKKTGKTAKKTKKGSEAEVKTEDEVESPTQEPTVAEDISDDIPF